MPDPGHEKQGASQDYALWICDRCGDHSEDMPGDPCHECGEGTVRSVPAVRCDDEAIERAEEAFDLHRFPEVGWHRETNTYAVYFMPSPGALGVQARAAHAVIHGFDQVSDASKAVPRLTVEAVLRAAGELRPSKRGLPEHTERGPEVQ